MFWDDNLILKAYRGSIAYGTNITKQLAQKEGLKESDVDFLGICVPPKEHMIGLLNFEQYESKDPDQTIFALRKYINLALNCNPNIVETLFTPRQYITYLHPIGQKLIDNRYLFLTKRAKHTFGGYAYAQQQKAMNPVAEKPDAELIMKNHGRGQGRIDLVARLGYDPKCSMHLIRLLRMGIEILVEGEIYVHRPDAHELLDIRLGKWSKQQILDETERLMKRLEDAYVVSTLPHKPDFDKIHQLCVELHEEYWGMQK